TMPSLIYIADPMCSWCYGFGPELTALLEGLPGMRLDIVVGGLRAHNTKVMDAELKSTLLGHWKKVQEKTGLPFSPAGLARDNFIYDTEPACRAVVAARMLAPQAELLVFHAIQRAFYERGEDVTQGRVLASVAAAALTEAGFPTDADSFFATWESDATVVATREDFRQTQHWGISGFPTLVLEREGKLELVAAGYVPMPTLVELLQALVDRDAREPVDGPTA
ncbi:MAG: DsbA family protein, partial [Noviherbaspirillum sp.]